MASHGAIDLFYGGRGSVGMAAADYTVKGGKQVDNVLKRMSISHLSHVKEDEKLYRCH